MMYDLGIKTSRIAAREGVPVNSIRNIARHYRATSRPRSGRPPINFERDLRAIMRIISNNPFIKNSDLV